MEFPLKICNYEEKTISSTALQDEIKTLFESKQVKYLMFSKTTEKDEIKNKLDLYSDLHNKMSLFFKNKNTSEIEIFLRNLFEYFQDKKDQESLLLYGTIMTSGINATIEHSEHEYELDILKEFIQTIENETEFYSLYYPEIVLQIVTSLKYFLPDELACALMKSLISLETDEPWRVLLSIYKLAKYNDTALHNYKTKLVDLILSPEMLESIESLIPIKFIKIIIKNVYSEIEDKIIISLRAWFIYIAKLLSSNMNLEDVEGLIQPLRFIRDICSMVSIKLQEEILNLIFEQIYSFYGKDIEKNNIFNYQKVSNIITDITANIISKKSVIIEREVLTNIRECIKRLFSKDDLEKSNSLMYWSISTFKAFLLSERDIDVVFNDKLLNVLVFSIKNRELDLLKACCSLLTKFPGLLSPCLENFDTIMRDIFISLERSLSEDKKSYRNTLYTFNKTSKVIMKQLEEEVGKKEEICVQKILNSMLFEPLLKHVHCVCLNVDDAATKLFGEKGIKTIREKLKCLGANLITGQFKEDEYKLVEEQLQYIELVNPLSHLLKHIGKLLAWILSENCESAKLCSDRLYKPIMDIVEPFLLMGDYDYYILSNLKNKNMRLMGNHKNYVLDIVEGIIKESFLSKDRPILTCSRIEHSFIKFSLTGYLLFAYSGVSYQFFGYFDALLHNSMGIYAKNTKLIKNKLFPFSSPSPLLHSFASYYEENGGLFGLWEDETSFLLRCLNRNRYIPEITVFSIRRQYDLHKETFGIMGNDTVFEIIYALYKYIIQVKSRVVVRDGLLLSFAVDTFISLFGEFEEGMAFVCEERSCDGLLESFRELAVMLTEK